MSIFVGNLPFRAEQEDIIELFSTYGEVTNCALPLERDTGRKRGFAFVEMSDEAAEASAIEALQGAELMGRPLRINKAEPRGSAPRRDFGGGGGGNSITVEFKEFGIRLSLTPTVLQQDRIVLKVAPEVSELDFDSGVNVQGLQIPGIRVRRTDTTVELGDGESFVISGLVDQDLGANVDKVPWLGDIPILGTFFRSTNYTRQDRELIMIVTPHLVTPLAKGTKVPLPGEKYDEYDPDSAELFFFERGEFEPGGAATGFTR